MFRCSSPFRVLRTTPVSPARAALGLVLAAGATGLLLVSGCRGGGGGAGGSPDGSPILATVGDYKITAKQLEDKIRAVHGSSTVEGALGNPDQVQIALSSIMDQLVWGRVAMDAGYDKDPRIARDVELYRAEQMAKKYLADTIDKDAEPTEEELKAFYEENKSHYIRPIRAAIRDIQLSSRARAEQVLAEARAGGDFAALARQYSEDTATRELGGALGYVTENDGALGIGKDPHFTKTALELTPGQISDIVEVGGRFHILMSEDREGGEPLTLNDVRDDITRRAKPKKFNELYNAALEKARRKYRAEVNEKNFNIFVGVTDSAERLWEMVSEATEARGRVELSRRLTFDFPRHDLADDAQLMIAYTQAVDLKDRKAGEKALQSFKSRFPNSPLMGSATWLLEHVNDTEIPVKSFDDLLTHSKR